MCAQSNGSCARDALRGQGCAIQAVGVWRKKGWYAMIVDKEALIVALEDEVEG